MKKTKTIFIFLIIFAISFANLFCTKTVSANFSAANFEEHTKKQKFEISNLSQQLIAVVRDEKLLVTSEYLGETYRLKLNFYYQDTAYSIVPDFDLTNTYKLGLHKDSLYIHDLEMQTVSFIDIIGLTADNFEFNEELHFYPEKIKNCISFSASDSLVFVINHAIKEKLISYKLEENFIFSPYQDYLSWTEFINNKNISEVFLGNNETLYFASWSETAGYVVYKISLNDLELFPENEPVPFIVIPESKNLSMKINGDNLYFLKSTADKLSIYNFDTLTNKETILQAQTGNSKLNSNIYSISDYFLTNEEIYILDGETNSIKSFDNKNFEFANFYGNYGLGSGYYNKPTSISVESENILINDTDNYALRLLADNAEFNIYLPFKPFKSVMDKNNNIYVATDSALYLIKGFQKNSDFVPSQSDITQILQGNIGEIRLSVNDELYIADKNGQFYIFKEGQTESTESTEIDVDYKSVIKSFNIGGKTGEIYILTDNGIDVFSSKFQFLKNVSYPSGYDSKNFKDLYIDFSGNIFLFYSEISTSKIIQIPIDGEEDFLVTDLIHKQSNSVVLDYFAITKSGKVYFTSTNSHSFFVLDVNLPFTTEDTAPTVNLTSDPLDLKSKDYLFSFVEINDYPSTIFYPFTLNTLYKSANFTFYEDLIKEKFTTVSHLKTGLYPALLSAKDISGCFGDYIIIFNLEGESIDVGFVFKDAVTILQSDQQSSYQDGLTMFNTLLYKYPFSKIEVLQNEDYSFVTALTAGVKIKILSVVSSSINDDFRWYKVSYVSNAIEYIGYVSELDVTKYFEPEEIPYQSVSLRLAGDEIRLLSQPTQKGEVVLSLNKGGTVKLYKLYENYALVGVSSETGEEITGYISINDLESQDTAERQKTGAILLGLSALSILVFYVIKRRYIY